jgi:hypothetical protein
MLLVCDSAPADSAAFAPRGDLSSPLLRRLRSPQPFAHLSLAATADDVAQPVAASPAVGVVERVAVLAMRLRGVVDSVFGGGDRSQVSRVDTERGSALMVHVLPERVAEQVGDEAVREPRPLAVEDEVRLAVAPWIRLAIPDPVSISNPDPSPNPRRKVGQSGCFSTYIVSARSTADRTAPTPAAAGIASITSPHPGHVGATIHAYQNTPNTDIHQDKQNGQVSR